ncbi:ATP-binding cassette sub-family B member 6, mitochondrial isoform X2 [Thrips palmi]|nr:ATP-binding cassette sub-family B member 6, mitochondrial isoform X2 [Thrips palmi]XP_034235621.1 ATP-binding cassette sub-family B member 6, mitochondrial isoform X2 [Thrips palmi]XP_034235630.1 ATP-binding cassette sub-family B member 6, mitochondrial isoform X2 [Thrips palmi]XP_034235639.1 ATP-binding cassette sub-family B member 6, mitochondrial isoform X2 [Thrips palmi]XP_034235647.1 ATP-binding cassette sub-family B member 6, mitochondrial isoform X2 [Thrips palmi]
MILFCPPNITLNEIWVNGGTSQCFMDTVSNSITAGWLLLFGTSQLWIYHKYGTTVTSASLPKSQLYGLQILFLVLLPVLCISRFLVQATLVNGYAVYGYMILSLVLSLVQYPLSIALLVVERHYLLPSVPSRGHGLVLLLFWTLLFIFENLSFVNLRKDDWWFHLTTVTDKIEMALFVLRYVSCLGIFVLGLRAPGIMTYRDYYNIGAAGSEARIPIIEDPNSQSGSTWRNFWKKMRILAPFLWPRKEIMLQFRVLFCFLLLAGGRVINLYVPIFSKLIVDSITMTSPVFRFDLVIVYVLFKFLQGSGTGAMGLLNNLRSFLWIKIQQYTTREVELSLFQHLHGLSLRWHLGRKTGEVLRVMDRGTDSINNLLNYILFSIFPTITDIVIAVVFFVSSFNGWFGLIVFVTMTLYIAATIMVTEWRTKFQRRMNLADNAQKARSVDSLLNFETVKYYGAESYEVDAYKEAIITYQAEEWKNSLTLNILNTVQNFIISGGLLAGSLLCVHMIVDLKELTVGDYVLFASYIIQLYVPLNWFGTYYRAIQKNFVDMENMFDLLREEQEIVDIPGASPLAIRQGKIEFFNVSFSYLPERTVLKNVSFTVPGGKTVAIVGPSGSGKTTIMRLLFRFYDVDSGAIFVDGQNIKTVQQSSLRQNIGVVPQDTVLFNKSIMYNIQYARLDASEADVIAAAKSAEIHDRILTFPDKYESQVGERGLKLSGGEKQRVAIARTLLKSPAIVLLDEATSALDTQTERNIQAALHKVCTDRTTVIVAHRLSTIIHADEILVLKEGEIVERGSHADLIAEDGVYANMWQQQLKNEAENKKKSHTDEEGSDVGDSATR